MYEMLNSALHTMCYVCAITRNLQFDAFVSAWDIALPSAAHGKSKSEVVCAWFLIYGAIFIYFRNFFTAPNKKRPKRAIRQHSRLCGLLSLERYYI